jgi:hypothetical protein
MRRLLVLVVAAGVLGGCQDPYHHRGLSSGAARAANHSPGAAAPRSAPADTAPLLDMGAQATPHRVVVAFCAQWINWSWRTIERQRRRLAALASARLARELAAEAALRVHRPALARQWLAARGRVLTVEVMPGARVRAASCVAVEPQPGEGEGARGGRRVYLATVARTARGWALTRWVPQP